MQKWIISSLLTFVLVFQGASAFAQKGSSSSGRSYSSGRSSSSSSSGRSYSSGRSSSSSSSGRSYSSGSSKPSAPSSSGGSGKQYSSGNNTAPRPPPSNSSKPSSSGWNPGLSSAAQREQSRQAYQSATTPKSTYHTPKGEEKSLKADSPQVTTVRKYITHERYITYESRSSYFYGSISPYPYNDFYSPFLLGYMFSSAVNANERAMWVYCHRQDMDDARYREMLARDAQLEARLRELERQKIERNPNYLLPSMSQNPDLQYSQDFVTSAYNPAPPDTMGSSGLGKFFFWFFVVVLVVGVVGTGVYFFFVKEF